MLRSNCSRPITFVLVVMALVAVHADPASAHFVYEETNTYQTDSQCTTLWSEVSHGSHGTGYAKSRTESTQDLPIWGLDCRYDKAKPAGWLTSRWQYYYYNASTGQWNMCVYYPGWAYNSSTSIDLVLTWSWPLAYFAPCGTGYYATIAFGAVYDNGGWKPSNYQTASYVWSGMHYLP